MVAFDLLPEIVKLTNERAAERLTAPATRKELSPNACLDHARSG